MVRLSIIVDNAPNKIFDAGNAGNEGFHHRRTFKLFVLKERRRSFVLCVLVDHTNKIFYKMFLELKLHYFQYIYCSGRKHGSRKTAYLSNRICVSASLIS